MRSCYFCTMCWCLRNSMWVCSCIKFTKSSFQHTDSTCQIKDHSVYVSTSNIRRLTYDQFWTFRGLHVEFPNRGPCAALLKSKRLHSLPLIASLVGNNISNAFSIYQSKTVVLADKTEPWLRSTNGTLMESNRSLWAEKWTAARANQSSIYRALKSVWETERDLIEVNWGALPPLPFKI